jgi:hypothetical protein
VKAKEWEQPMRITRWVMDCEVVKIAECSTVNAEQNHKFRQLIFQNFMVCGPEDVLWYHWGHDEGCSGGAIDHAHVAYATLGVFSTLFPILGAVCRFHIDMTHLM